MIKLRYIFFISIVSLLVYACGNDDDDGDEAVDYAAQSVIDNDSIVSFLQKHYYDIDLDSVKPLVTGETALYDDPNLAKHDITHEIDDEDYDFSLYVYTIAEGDTSTDAKGYPTVVDSVLVNYYGQTIERTDSLSTATFDSNSNFWAVLGAGVISGWTYGVPNFRAGVNATQPNEPLTFANQGKGLLFIPSGLAYGDTGSGSISSNEPIMFNIELNDFVVDTDFDQDGVPSIDEVYINGLYPWEVDTDEDGVVDFADVDDDGDGIPTIYEDANEDGDPTNDFSDPNNPTIPDYLNPDISESNQD